MSCPCGGIGGTITAGPFTTAGGADPAELDAEAAGAGAGGAALACIATVAVGGMDPLGARREHPAGSRSSARIVAGPGDIERIVTRERRTLAPYSLENCPEFNAKTQRRRGAKK